MQLLTLRFLRRLLVIITLFYLSISVNADKGIPFNYSPAPVSDIDHVGMGTFSSSTTATTVLCTATDTDDGDGVADEFDNCPTISNNDQANFYRDGLGDACDTDDDNDGIADASDNCDSDPYIYPGATPLSMTAGGTTIALGTTSTFTYSINGNNSPWNWTVTFIDATGALQSITTKPGGTINPETSSTSILVTWPTDQPIIYVL